MRRWHAALALILACYAVLISVSGWSAQAQSSEVREIARRIAVVEAQNTGERLAKLEVLMEGVRGQMDTTNKLLLGVLASLVLMLAERAVRGRPGGGEGRRMVRQVFRVAAEDGE
jgi:hypothetical protein